MAQNTVGRPSVILAQTVKGYGLGTAGEGMNITHQQKKLNEEQLRDFRDRFDIPLTNEEISSLPFYRPAEDSKEMQYLFEKRTALGGFNPQRHPSKTAVSLPSKDLYQEFLDGTGGRPVSTTMAAVRILAKLMQDKTIGSSVVPIVPDEARTFGMEALFRQAGIYSHPGQLYEPVDRENLLYYREAKDGQIIEEGITEAGGLSSFIAAGTAYANHGITTIPFFLFYSMFGLQRVGDLVWAAADSRTKGFLLGATAGRTTLAGEGLQHQDGNSLILALTVPNLMAYDPGFAYEVAVIVEDGLKRMYENNEDVFYYIAIMNENYEQPPIPQGVEKGILKGLYRYLSAEDSAQIRLFGSGSILPETIKARSILKEEFGVDAEVWSATSYKELYRNGQETDRWNRLHPETSRRKSYVEECLGDALIPVVAASDYLKALPASIAPQIKSDFTILGTDGFGRSDGRESLRSFFEVKAEDIVVAALSALTRSGSIVASVVTAAVKKFKIDPEAGDPVLR